MTRYADPGLLRILIEVLRDLAPYTYTRGWMSNPEILAEAERRIGYTLTPQKVARHLNTLHQGNHPEVLGGHVIQRRILSETYKTYQWRLEENDG